MSEQASDGADDVAGPPAMAFRPDWLARVEEAPLDAGRDVVDPHFHFFDESEVFPHYRLPDLQADTAGHRVRRAVYIQCEEHYRTQGPEHLKPVGETEWVAGLAAQAAQRPDAVQIAGMIGAARLLEGARIRETLEAHLETSGLFRGIRDMGLWDEDPLIARVEDATGLDLYGEPRFREGFRELADLGLVFDAHQYHTQLFSLTALARAFPDTTIVLDHLGSPLGERAYADRRDEVFEEWRKALAEIARCENVVIKLGGLAMPWNGFGWERRPKPPSSDEFVETYRPYYRWAIEQFGPERCLFESNFPVDRLSLSYTVLWNAFKKLAAEYSDTEQDAMLRANALRVYRLEAEA